MARAANRIGIQFPDRIDDRMIVSVEDVLSIFRVSGDMNLSDTFGGDFREISVRIETVVLRRET